jgi:hypothetical protein
MSFEKQPFCGSISVENAKQFTRSCKLRVGVNGQKELEKQPQGGWMFIENQQPPEPFNVV